MPDTHRLHRRRTLALFTLAFAGLSLGASSGCYFEGGPGWSADRFAYVSRTWTPKTVTLVDTRTGESLWSMDVPVGQRLVIDFRKAPRNVEADDWLPDVMQWDLMPESRRFGALKNQIRVPPSMSRRVEMTLRPTPEYPPESDTGDATWNEATSPTAPERITRD
ncbi:MAG: hypothetical protein EA379_09860 [Phycisphaerales bacterium]|nr:MAG: hypothetical protein EA379_09860 [Phycisphaerales bacterium]